MVRALPSPHIEIDRASAVPVYRQIADALRYRIATGDIEIGTRLPTVHEGSRLWRINLHTVRRAYAELASDGMVQMQRGRGTVVMARAPVPHTVSHDGVGAFVEWAASRAALEHGLSRAEFADLITATSPPRAAQRGVFVLECSEHQARQLAGEIARRWGVKTRGWSLEWADEPAVGPFIATYFHYNDIRRRWPHRMKDAVFVSIRPSQALGQALRKFGRRPGPVNVRLVEREETMARSIAADVSAILPSPRYKLAPQIIKGPLTRLQLEGGALYLFSPRLWASLSDKQRGRANALEVEYDIPGAEHARLAYRFGWQEQGQEQN